MNPESPRQLRGLYILGGIAVLVLAVSLLVPPGRLPALPLCTFKSWTGLPCLTCGMTHAFCSIGHGAWRQAWSYQPFAFVLYALAIIVAALPLISRWRPLWLKAIPVKWILAGGILLVLAMVLFWLHRLGCLLRG